MGKSTIGPDMRDCATYLLEVQRQQRCLVSVFLDVAGSEDVPLVYVRCVATEGVGEVKLEGWTVGVQLLWPNRENKTFESAVFRTLALLDAEIARNTFQEILNIA